MSELSRTLQGGGGMRGRSARWTGGTSVESEQTRPGTDCENVSLEVLGPHALSLRPVMDAECCLLFG